MVKKTVGELVKEKRVAKGWSLEELAHHTEPRISASGIHRIEKGERSPSVATLRKIAEALEVSPKDLLPD